jgi:SAM-dependent methyltransferase
MAKPGEVTYFSQIGDDGRAHARNKPFSDPECPEMLCNAAFFLGMLPPPPARILECGCGTAWLSYFLAKRGYQCVGQDISQEALDLAKEFPVFQSGEPVHFECADFENMGEANQYDAVIFNGSLHHAEDEQAAIDSAYRVLKKGGVFLSIEPGVGHEKRSRKVIELYNVGDRDMPPKLQLKCGRKSGFSEFKVYIHPSQLFKIFFERTTTRTEGLLNYALKIPGVNYLALIFIQFFYKRNDGAVLMRK